MKIAIYGGSFDPIHIGHEAIIRLLSNEFDEVWVAICQNTSYRKHLSLPSDRYNMMKLVVDKMKKSNIFICIDPLGKTYNLVKSFTAHYNDITFVIGSDSLPHLKKWYRLKQLEKMCKFSVVPRHGVKVSPWKWARQFKIYDLPITDSKVSSSEIREYIKRNRDMCIDWKHELREFLDYDVIKYISTRWLYPRDVYYYKR
jgi:nicotinate-nucleotide adenylyltransferase